MEHIRFKSPNDFAYNAFFSCRVLNCELEAEKLYATAESSIIDVCSNHHKQLKEMSSK